MQVSPARPLRLVRVVIVVLAGLAAVTAPTAQAAFAQRVDVAAASPYIDLAGNEWAADRKYQPGGFGYVGGVATVAEMDIANTSDPTLYRTFRRGPSFEYRFDVPDGTYAVLLRFAELWPPNFEVGERMFDVTAEGVPVLVDFDLFGAAGAAAAVDRTFVTEVTDGTLDIGFEGSIHRAVVNAIAVESSDVGDFTLDVDPTTVTMAPDGGASVSAEIGFVNGFTSTSVDLWSEGLPGGVTGVFAPDPLTHEGMSLLTLTGDGSASDGTYALTIGATAEGITHTVQVILVVNSAPDFDLTASPASQGVAAGGSASYQVDVLSENGFTGEVTLSVSGWPDGAFATFDPPTVVPTASAALTISTTEQTAPGEYPLAITGTSGAISHSTVVFLGVAAGDGAWEVSIIGSTGVAMNSMITGDGRSDGVDRVYVGTVNTGRVMELSWDGTEWEPIVDIGGSPEGEEIHNLAMGQGRDDGRTRIYACSLDGHLYELSFDGGDWSQTTIGIADPPCTHAVVGDGRNDGVTRLYATRNQTVWEYSWTGSEWNAVRVDSVSQGIVHGIDLGPGRGGLTIHLYVASSAEGTFEATFANGAWSMTSMGDGGDVRNVSLGDGRGDGVMRVYAGVQAGVVREFTWTGSGWTATSISDPVGSVIVHAYVRDGRGDGVPRVYAAAGDGHGYEFTWTGSGWLTVDMGGGSAYLYGFAPGNRPGETRTRLYGAAFDGNVYEFSWS